MPAPPPLFPSPRGDKLCRLVASAQHQLVLFPSPRGDKLCQMTAEDLISTYEFPVHIMSSRSIRPTVRLPSNIRMYSESHLNRDETN